jgi:hypothetical protein
MIIQAMHRCASESPSSLRSKLIRGRDKELVSNDRFSPARQSTYGWKYGWKNKIQNQKGFSEIR